MMKILKSKLLWTLLSMIFLAMIFIKLMPKPIDMNLEKIGNGKASVVFIYDLNLSVSNPQALEMNRAKEALGEQVNFLIVKIGDPTTNAFKQRYKARATELLFFDGRGELVDRKSALITAEEFLGRLSAR